MHLDFYLWTTSNQSVWVRKAPEPEQETWSWNYVFSPSLHKKLMYNMCGLTSITPGIIHLYICLTLSSGRAENATPRADAEPPWKDSLHQANLLNYYHVALRIKKMKLPVKNRRNPLRTFCLVHNFKAGGGNSSASQGCNKHAVVLQAARCAAIFHPTGHACCRTSERGRFYTQAKIQAHTWVS